MVSKDENRRLRILEVALGIDLDASQCSGDPMNCPEDPCDQEHCPLAQNNVVVALRLAEQASEDARVAKHLIQLIQGKDENLVHVARLRAEEELLVLQVQHAEQLQELVGMVEDARYVARKRRLAEVRRGLRELGYAEADPG